MGGGRGDGDWRICLVGGVEGGGGRDVGGESVCTDLL